MSTIDTATGVVDRIKRSLVGLKMPMALEIVDVILRRIERGEVSALEAIDLLLFEELTLRETRRVKTALVMARLSTIKTLTSFDFAFQPTLDRSRVLALAELKFIERAEVLHFLGPPGTGKSHLAVALGVEAVKMGYSVYFVMLADLVSALAKAEREGYLREKIKFFCRFALLIVDEIGYLPRNTGRRKPVLPVGERTLRAWRNDPHLQSRLCRVGRRLQRYCRRHGVAGSIASSCRGSADRGVELSAPTAQRSRARPHQDQSADPDLVRCNSKTTRTAPKGQEPRSRPRLITPSRTGENSKPQSGESMKRCRRRRSAFPASWGVARIRPPDGGSERCRRGLRPRSGALTSSSATTLFSNLEIGV